VSLGSRYVVSMNIGIFFFGCEWALFQLGREWSGCGREVGTDERDKGVVCGDGGLSVSGFRVFGGGLCV
jgi:hypothetical protein